MEGYWQRGEGGRMGGKVQGTRNITTRYKMGGLKIVWEMEKAKNLYV